MLDTIALATTLKAWKHIYIVHTNLPNLFVPKRDDVIMYLLVFIVFSVFSILYDDQVDLDSGQVNGAQHLILRPFHIQTKHVNMLDIKLVQDVFQWNTSDGLHFGDIRGYVPLCIPRLDELGVHKLENTCSLIIE